MQLRYATHADALQLMHLFHDTVHSVNIRDYSQEQVDVWAPEGDTVARWRERQATHITFVAEEAGLIMGFAELEAGTHIDCFYVHKDHQGEGIGTRLLAALIAEARAMGATHLHAEASITARPFFERHGFRVVTPQDVVVRGTTFRNYVMERTLGGVSEDQ